MSNIKYSGFDIFSGAGGLSVGAEWAGITVKVAIECEPNSASTYRFNHPHTRVEEAEIQTVNPESLMKGSPFILFGGPPCQGFSTSNTRTRNSTNPNNGLFEEFIRFVDILNPQWFIFENVEGIGRYEKGEVVRRLENLLGELGYNTWKKILRASDFGVPQTRHRFFLVGNRDGLPFEFPKANATLVTVNDAIGDLPFLENGDLLDQLQYRTEAHSTFARLMRRQSASSLQNFVSRNQDYVIQRYRHIGPGQNWQAIPPELMQNYSGIERTHSGIYRRLDPEQPSVVISNYRKNMLIHPEQHRGLSVREAARLQSFPDHFVFKGSVNSIQQQIGNAVPPLLAYELFRSIMQSVKNERLKRKQQRALLEV